MPLNAKEVRNSVYEFLNKSKEQKNLREVIKIISSKGKTHKLGKLVSKEIKGEEFIFHGRGAYANLNFLDDEFTLLESSIIIKNYAEYFPTSFSGLFKLRKELIAKGILKEQNDENYILTKNLEFSSPSPCACLCAGASYNGFTAFKLKNVEVD